MSVICQLCGCSHNNTACPNCFGLGVSSGVPHAQFAYTRVTDPALLAKLDEILAVLKEIRACQNQ